jgi:hypothetical protein
MIFIFLHILERTFYCNFGVMKEGEVSAFTLFPVYCVLPDDGHPVSPKYVAVLIINSCK